MNRRLRDELNRNGLTVQRFGPVEGDPELGLQWGISILHEGEEVAVVTDTPHVYGGDGYYYLRHHRRGASLGAYLRQRDAVAALIRELVERDGTPQ